MARILEGVKAEWTREAAVCNLVHPDLDNVSIPSNNLPYYLNLWKYPKAGTIRFEWGNGEYAEFHDALIVRYAEVRNLVEPDYTYELRCGTGHTNTTNQVSWMGKGGGPDNLPKWLNGHTARMTVVACG